MTLNKNIKYLMKKVKIDLFGKLIHTKILITYKHAYSVFFFLPTKKKKTKFTATCAHCSFISLVNRKHGCWQCRPVNSKAIDHCYILLGSKTKILKRK